MIQFELSNKFFKIFNKQEKYLFFFLISSQFIVAGLELLSIGSLLPIFKAITDPEWNKKYFYFFEEENRIIYIFSLVIFLFIFKSIFIVIISYFTGKFRNKVTLRIIDTIYTNYLNKKYQFYINNHSSILLRNMNYADQVDSIIMRLVNFYSDLILTIMALIAVTMINLKVSLFLSLLITIILIFYAILTKKNISKYGSNNLNYNTSYLKNMMEGIKSYREILLSGKQDYFTKRNRLYKEQSLRYKLRFFILELIPKYIIELVFISGILVVAGYFISKKNIDILEYIPILGILLLGFIKLLPSLLRIFTSYQQFKYLLPQLEITTQSLINVKTKDDLDEIKNTELMINFKKDLKFNNINFEYNEKTILKNINFELKKNECIAIQGESGSGKSTLLNLISGLLSPTSGQILIDNLQVNLQLRNWQKKIGYVSQNTRLLDDTIKNNIRFGSEEDDKEKLDYVLEVSGLNSFVSSLPNKLDTLVGENGAKISGGQSQRIGIARAFYCDPEILILDEPTNSLDKENEEIIIKTLLKLKGKITIIIVSHNLEPLKIADRNYQIKNGNLINY